MGTVLQVHCADHKRTVPAGSLRFGGMTTLRRGRSLDKLGMTLLGFGRDDNEDGGTTGVFGKTKIPILLFRVRFVSGCRIGEKRLY